MRLENTLLGWVSSVAGLCTIDLYSSKRSDAPDGLSSPNYCWIEIGTYYIVTFIQKIGSLQIDSRGQPPTEESGQRKNTIILPEASVSALNPVRPSGAKKPSFHVEGPSLDVEAVAPTPRFNPYADQVV